MATLDHVRPHVLPVLGDAITEGRAWAHRGREQLSRARKARRTMRKADDGIFRHAGNGSAV
jgi:hypothetical protein